MRNLHLLLLIPVLLFVVYFVYDTQANEPPSNAALKFLTTLQQGDIDAVVMEFGDNTCHCAPEGGYISYVQYQSGHDPNLSFLLGRKFDIGKPTVEKLPYNGEKYAFPWEKPEDTLVQIPLQFPEGDQPYFLPPDMAYGYEMADAQVKAFEKDPALLWMRGFTLRLRNSLQPGTIPARDPKAKQTEMERAAKEGILPKEYLRYMHPKDAAAVKMPDGKTTPASDVAAQLPRLKSINIGMKVVRRGLLGRWAVKKAGFDKPVIIAGGKDIELARPGE